MINHFSRIIEPIQSSIQQYYTFFEFCKAEVASQPHYHKNCKLIPLKIFDLVHNRIIAKEKRRPQKEEKNTTKNNEGHRNLFWGEFFVYVIVVWCCLCLVEQHTVLVYFSSVLSSKISHTILVQIHTYDAGGKNVQQDMGMPQFLQFWKNNYQLQCCCCSRSHIHWVLKQFSYFWLPKTVRCPNKAIFKLLINKYFNTN